MPEASAQSVVRTHDELASRLEWLMFFRVVIVTVLLGSSVVFRLSDQDLFFNTKRVTLLVVIIGTYVLTIIYAFVLRAIRSHYDKFAYVQVLIDMLITLFSLGSLAERNLFSVLFSLCVLSIDLAVSTGCYVGHAGHGFNRVARRSRGAGMVASIGPRQ